MLDPPERCCSKWPECLYAFSVPLLLQHAASAVYWTQALFPLIWDMGLGEWWGHTVCMGMGGSWGEGDYVGGVGPSPTCPPAWHTAPPQEHQQQANGAFVASS